MFREFNGMDWYSWGGAECFEDGSNPMIWQEDEKTIIIDKDQIGIYIYLGDDIVYLANYECLTKQEKVIVGNQVINLIRQTDNYDLFIKLLKGFERIF